MLSAKQGGIMYYILSLWYGSTWDWNPVSKTNGEHSTHLANGPRTKKKDDGIIHVCINTFALDQSRVSVLRV